MRFDDLSILLVEDDTLISQDLEMSLSRKGARVTTANCVVTGMAAASARFDVAILDIRLHELDVIPVAEKLSKQNVPLIFHSVVSIREDVADLFPSAKSLSKPVRETTLLEAVLESTKGS